jgi:predicted outer membrane repeat protein
MLRAPTVVLRTVATAITLAGLYLAWPLQVVRAQTLTPSIPAAVATASSTLQSAIQTGGDVPGALGNYNAAVSTAASPHNLVPNPLAGPITTLQSVGSQALIIFAEPQGTLTFSNLGRVTIGSGGGFFLGPGTVDSSTMGNPSASSAFTFSLLTSTGSNGGAIVNSGTATITNSNFGLNSVSGTSAGASQNGGAIANNSTGTLTITNSNFMNNRVPGPGGLGSGSGGAISNSGTAAITNSSFMNNSVSGSGGAIFNSGTGTAAITNSSFMNNSGAGGGAIFNNGGGRLTITNSSFTNNSTPFSGNDSGGAINNFGNLMVTGSKFTTNSSVFGGAINVFGTVTITNSSFSGNFTQPSNLEDLGGAIDISGRLTITNSSFKNNTATEGGAVANENRATITDSSFENNVARNNGGAIWTRLGDTISTTLNAMSGDIAVTGNTAVGHGGGIYLDAGSLSLNATGGDIRFSASTDGSGANAIYINRASAATIFNAGAGHAISFFDPIASNAANGLVTVTKTGDGTVIFDGSLRTNESHIYANTEVKEGTFEIANNAVYGARATGGAEPSSFTVDSDATLAGGVAGTVRVDEFTLRENATLDLFFRPPGTRGVFTIDAGSATFQPGSRTLLGIGGLEGNQYDHVQVNGNASLAGTLVVSSLSGVSTPPGIPFHPSAGDAFLVLRTNGTRSGNFSLLDESQFNNNPTIPGQLKPVAVEVEAPNGVLLVYVTRPPTIPPPTIPPTPPIIDETPKPLPPEAPFPEEVVVQLLDPTAEQLTSLYQVGFTGAWLQRSNLDDRMFQLQQSYVPAPPPPVTAPITKGTEGKEIAPPPAPAPSTPRFGVWASGYGNWTHVGTNLGYHFDMAGMSAGVDYLIKPQWAVGLFGGYAHNWINFRSNGSADSDTGLGGLYTTYFNPTGWWVNAAVWGGGTSYSTSRQALLGPANGSTNGWLISTYGEAGYDLHCGALAYGPFVLMQYTDTQVNGFTEHGSLVPLSIHEDSQDSLVTDVGGRIYYNAHLGQMAVIPQLKLAWEHEYLYSSLPLSVTAPTLGGATATFHGPSIGHDSLMINAGVLWQVNPRIAITVSYDGQLARDHYYSNGVDGVFSWSF